MDENRRRQPEFPPHKDSLPGRYVYKYPHPAVTTDCVIFGLDNDNLKLLLIERGGEPFKGYWALPGGFIHTDETLEEGAARELREETNLRNIYLEQFKAYSEPARDPRERVITVAFIALVRPLDFEVVAGDDAESVHWFDFNELPPLAFDHHRIVNEAREHLKEILLLKPIAFRLLNEYFSLSELQRVYEIINEASYDRRNFTRSVQEAGIVEATDMKPEKARNRPPKMYRAVSQFSLAKEDDSEGEVFFDCCIPDDEILPEPAAPSMPPPKESPTKGLFDFLRRFTK